jgi:glyoxylase-like metal-dependent hydrolase (beta-lactamase superfamily II)
MHPTQAPGFYRLMVGDIEVTALNDGTFAMPVGQLLKGISGAELRNTLDRAFLTDPTISSVNGFLINTGTRLILIDTGAGDLFGPTLGRLADNLALAGYRADQVDEVYITHMHGDHIGGLTRKGIPVFVNAIVRVAQSEAGYWLDASQSASAPPETRDSFKSAARQFEPYIKAHHFETFKDEGELSPGVTALAAHGHTPGHTVYQVSSQGQSLVIWGDLMHAGAVQFKNPLVTIGFDSDQAAAQKQRLNIFNQSAQHQTWVAGAHLPFPGIGHLLKQGDGFDYIPVNYSTQF